MRTDNLDRIAVRRREIARIDPYRLGLASANRRILAAAFGSTQKTPDRPKSGALLTPGTNIRERQVSGIRFAAGYDLDEALS